MEPKICEGWPLGSLTLLKATHWLTSALPALWSNFNVVFLPMLKLLQLMTVEYSKGRYFQEAAGVARQALKVAPADAGKPSGGSTTVSFGCAGPCWPPAG